MVFGAFVKLLVVLFGIVVFAEASGPIAVAGALLSIGGACAYGLSSRPATPAHAPPRRPWTEMLTVPARVRADEPEPNSEELEDFHAGADEAGSGVAPGDGPSLQPSGAARA